jgi:hypothetical protein
MLECRGNSHCPESSADHVGTQQVAMTNKRPLGRPRVLTKALKEEICTRIMDGQTVRTICADGHMPAERTVYRALAAEGEDEFRQQYVRAREIQLMRWEDDLLEIADDGRNDWVEKRNAAGEVIGWTVNGEHIQRSRARLETRKWLMSKRAPKKYGDKIEQTVLEPNGSTIPHQRTYRFVVVRLGDCSNERDP